MPGQEIPVPLGCAQLFVCHELLAQHHASLAHQAAFHRPSCPQIGGLVARGPERDVVLRNGVRKNEAAAGGRCERRQEQAPFGIETGGYRGEDLRPGRGVDAAFVNFVNQCAELLEHAAAVSSTMMGSAVSSVSSTCGNTLSRQ